jgi:uncharacterized protein (UPF0332 family)
MKNGIINLEQEYVDMIRLAQERENKRDAKTLREEYQYGTETAMEDAICIKIMDDARRFVDRIKEALETQK